MRWEGEVRILAAAPRDGKKQTPLKPRHLRHLGELPGYNPRLGLLGRPRPSF
jgi:hypothetical protein